MFGEVIFHPKGRGRPEPIQRYGLWLMQLQVNPEGKWGKWRLRRGLERLKLAQVHRVLLPEEFLSWDLLEQQELRPIDILPFLQHQSPALLLTALAHRGKCPAQGAVALRGYRADQRMAQAAEYLVPHVRDLAIWAPVGGEELARWLRLEYGIPVRPDGPDVMGAICFHPSAPTQGDTVLQVHTELVELAGLHLCSPNLDQGDQEALPLLAALWECGRLEALGLEIT